MYRIITRGRAERNKVVAAIQQGQQDGSLRADMEPELMIAALSNCERTLRGVFE